MRRRAPTTDELRAFRLGLSRLGVTSRAVEPHLTALDVDRHEFLLEAGDDPNRSGFVVSGVVREYYQLDDGTERTRGFALPQDTYGSLSDALAERPCRVFVRAEADSVVLEVSWRIVGQLAATSLEWERLQHRIVQTLYLRKATREYELLGLDAMGRYQSLRAQHPTLESHVSQALIASYLGITPVHLSRLRRRLRKRGPS